MAIEAASGCWSEAETRLAAALPQLAGFRAFVGAATPSEAAAYIDEERIAISIADDHLTKDEVESLEYTVIIASKSEQGFTLTRAEWDGFEPSGTILLYLDRLLTPADEYSEPTARENMQAMNRWMKNRAYEIMGELSDYLEQNGGPFIKSLSVTEGPFFNEPGRRQTEGHWQGIELSIEWGR